MKNAPYQKLGISLALSFMAMYAVMFLNVASSDHVYLSLTRFYMTLLMICPMAIIMLLTMPGMYSNRKRNIALLVISVAVFFASLVGLRQQVFIGDEQYMRGMISHHSSAIMTSQKASITDPEVVALAQGIIRSQEEEIAQMKSILQRMRDDANEKAAD